MKTLGLWLLLIVLFVGFYQYFSPNGRIPGWVSPATVLFAIIFIGIALRGGKSAQRGIQLNSEGILLLANGRVAPALEKFEAARPLLARQWKAVIAFNIGLCQMSLWRLDAAELEFSQALSGQSNAQLQPQLLPRYALVAALRARAQVARERIENARRVDPDSALLMLADAVLECRRGDWAQTRRLLEDPSTHVLGGPLRGLRDALLCWSVEQTSGERRYLDLVTVFGEASTDKLRESWPELVGYLLERSAVKT